MPTLIVLIGPTGVGKTELSLRLAENFQTHIVSADSRQLYAELKIGTAAPTPEQLERVPHHLVGRFILQTIIAPRNMRRKQWRFSKSYSCSMRWLS